MKDESLEIILRAFKTASDDASRLIQCMRRIVIESDDNKRPTRERIRIIRELAKDAITTATPPTTENPE